MASDLLKAGMPVRCLYKLEFTSSDRSPRFTKDWAGSHLDIVCSALGNTIEGDTSVFEKQLLIIQATNWRCHCDSTSFNLNIYGRCWQIWLNWGNRQAISIVDSAVTCVPVADPKNSTDYTPTTPPATEDDYDSSSGAKPSFSVPWPGSTFIIRSVLSGHVITLLDGQVVLAPPGGRGSIHWVCVESKGWLGFKNPVSGRFLGHDKNGRLCCLVEHHKGWKDFCVRMRPEGGYVLLMTHFEKLWHLGINLEQGVEKLAKIENGESDGIVWAFEDLVERGLKN